MHGGGDRTGEALRRSCIADNSVLAPLVQAGGAHILDRILPEPLWLAPVVLDADELLLPGFPVLPARPASEFLRLLHVRAARYESYRDRVPHIAAFAAPVGIHWRQVTPTEDEMRLTERFRRQSIRREVRKRCPDVNLRAPLDAGEAEALAVAATRGWTLLVDDQAAVTVARCLYPDVPIVRLCQLLVYAVTVGVLSCSDASALYGEEIRGRIGFYSSLHIDCDPPRCAPDA